jgi:hypothetical protein
MNEQPRSNPISAERDQDVASIATAGEPVVVQVDGLGALLVVTATRVILVRQGAHFRPRNGVREWPLTALRDVQLAPPRNGNGRLVLRTGPYPWQAVNLFVSGQQWADAERAAGQIRVRLAQARRPSPAYAGPGRGRLAPDPLDRG